MLLQSISHVRPEVYKRAVRTQGELWERVWAVVGGEWERGWSRSWSVDPEVTLREVLEDLEYGRD